MADITIPSGGVTDPPTNESNNQAEPLTPGAMLREVNNALYNIMVGGQAYTIGSRSLTRANLSELRALKKELEAETQADTSSSSLFGDTYVAMFNGR